MQIYPRKCDSISNHLHPGVFIFKHFISICRIIDESCTKYERKRMTQELSLCRTWAQRIEIHPRVLTSKNEIVRSTRVSIISTSRRVVSLRSRTNIITPLPINQSINHYQSIQFNSIISIDRQNNLYELSDGITPDLLCLNLRECHGWDDPNKPEQIHLAIFNETTYSVVWVSRCKSYIFR